MQKIPLPQNVSNILKTFTDNGYRAFIVGGCVRDSIMGKIPNDWDITTNAKPKDIKRLFQKTVDTGIAHGTVTVIIDNEPYEVTTFRKDGEYIDGRHPEYIEYTDDLNADLSRRDFTVNAMAYNDTSGLLDPFGGIYDLQNNKIKCVGNPAERFKEDALRMLRAVRFSAQLSFTIEDDVKDALKDMAQTITKISSERIRDEINKIILSDNAEDAFLLLHECTILKYILPELDKCFTTQQNIKYHLYNVGVHSLKVVSNTSKKLHLRYAALLHDIGKPQCRKTDENGIDTFRNHAKVSTALSEKVLKRLRLDNKNIDKILRLILHHDREIIPQKKAVKRAVLDVGDDIFLDLIDLKKSEVFAQNTVYTLPRLNIYNNIIELYNDIKLQNEAMNLSSLDINGNDIINLGYSGKNIGIILNHVLLYIINNPESNKKEKIIKIIKKNVNKWLKND